MRRATSQRRPKTEKQRCSSVQHTISSKKREVCHPLGPSFAAETSIAVREHYTLHSNPTQHETSRALPLSGCPDRGGSNAVPRREASLQAQTGKVARYGTPQRVGRLLSAVLSPFVASWRISVRSMPRHVAAAVARVAHVQSSRRTPNTGAGDRAR